MLWRQSASFRSARYPGQPVAAGDKAVTGSHLIFKRAGRAARPTVPLREIPRAVT